MGKIKKFRYLILFVFLFLGYNCSSISYYGHNIHGHFSMLSKRVPIDELLAEDSKSAHELKRKLRLALKIREFAAKELDLPNHGSYQHYVALKKPYIKWNVIAAPELSIKPKLWCFFVVGCVSYRGYYTEQAARTFAKKVQAQGYDTYISGAIAYSTLGWFDDPLLSTMMQWSDFRMAEFIIHELAHQKLYIKHGQDFNEAFATMVAQYGVEKWSRTQQKPEQWRKYLKGKQKEKEFIQLALSTRNELESLYQSDKSDADKRQHKKAIFGKMYERYQQQLKAGKVRKLEKWFKNLNNAKFTILASYQRYVPAFLALFSQHQGKLTAFYQAVKQLGKQSQETRRTKLEQLLIKSNN